MKKISSVFITLAVIFMIIGLICLWKGFDYKNNYYNSDDYSSLNQHAYVGGDAYNYIINGTYFGGYITMSMGFEIIAAIFVCFGIHCYLKASCPTFDSLKTTTQNTMLNAKELYADTHIVKKIKQY